MLTQLYNKTVTCNLTKMLVIYTSLNNMCHDIKVFPDELTICIFICSSYDVWPWLTII